MARSNPFIRLFASVKTLNNLQTLNQFRNQLRSADSDRTPREGVSIRSQYSLRKWEQRYVELEDSSLSGGHVVCGVERVCAADYGKHSRDRHGSDRCGSAGGIG